MGNKFCPSFGSRSNEPQKRELAINGEWRNHGKDDRLNYSKLPQTRPPLGFGQGGRVWES